MNRPNLASAREGKAVDAINHRHADPRATGPFDHSIPLVFDGGEPSNRFERRLLAEHERSRARAASRRKTRKGRRR